MTGFPIDHVRAQFPALDTAGDFVFLDNAAGAQVPRDVFEAIHDHLLHRNVQRGGRYPRSIAMDEAIARARRSVAAFLGAEHADEIAFGLNATSFIRAVSLAVGHTIGERDEIVVTELDHEANVATWLALESLGATIRWWKASEEARLDPALLEPLLSTRTRLVACPMASNATGTTVDVAEVCARAHAVGAEVFVDAVHYAPHGPIDVRRLDCDYLVCSGYKIFGPHMGFLWGRMSSLEALPTFREHFIPDAPPMKLEAGTFVYENVVGMDAALGYLADLGRRTQPAAGAGAAAPDQVESLRAAMEAIRSYEAELSAALLALSDRVPGVRIHGVRDRAEVAHRTPTLLFGVDGVAPSAVTDHMVAAGLGVRDGHMYAPRLMRRIGLGEEAGAVRASLVHYNTVGDVERMAVALEALATSEYAGRR